MVDVETGLPADNNAKKVIFESFKPKDVLFTDLEKFYNKDKLRTYDSEKNNTVLKFY